ncbi:DNA translocase FtsK [Camelimonas sp. ID_303_24]
MAARYFMKRRAFDLVGIALIVFAITMAIALITWSVSDPSLTHATDSRISNWLGAPGAVISDMAMQLFGLGSVAWLLPLAVWGVSLVTRRTMPGMKWRIPLWIIGASAAAAVASAMPATGSWPLPTGLGGVVGDGVLAAARNVLGVLGAFGRVLAGFIMAAIAILALSAACGYGFDEQASEDDTDMDSWRASRGKDTDSDEPGLGIVSLGAVVHGFMMLKAAIGRRRSRRKLAATAAGAAAMAGVSRAAARTPGGRVEPSAFPDDFSTAAPDYTPALAPVAAPVQPAEPPRSRVRMPPTWHETPAVAAASGVIEPPWRQEEAPSPVHAAYAPAHMRAGSPRDADAGYYQDAETAAPQMAAAPAWSEPVEAAPAHVHPQPAQSREPASVAAHAMTHAAETTAAAARAAVGVATRTATAPQKIIPTAAAIAAAAELSSRFAARVRRKAAASEEMSENEDTAGDDAAGYPADAIDTAEAAPVEATQPFVLHRKRKEPESEIAPDLEETEDDNDAFGDADVDMAAETDPVAPMAPRIPSHALRVGVPAAMTSAGPANDDAVAARPSQAQGGAAATARPVAKAPAAPAQPTFDTETYQLPELALLAEPRRPAANSMLSVEALEQNATLLEGVLEDFGVRGEIINVRPGPVVTLYELEPAPGTKSSRVISLADDIARSMSAISARVAVVPGRNAIGIELPNSNRETVYLRELLASEDFSSSKSRLGLCLGKTIGGEPVIADLARMPHLLVAGTTGSGKSVAINTMILSLLYRLRPDECRLIMVDPKMLELSIYDGIPHLLTPVVTDPKKAVVALKWAVREMEDRYKKMSKLGVRNIDGFNTRVGEAKRKGEIITRTLQTGFDKQTGEPVYEEEVMDLDPLPYIVVIVDEMADLMMVAGKEIEGTIQRLAQMARAAGIHVVLATQRPSVDVITGTIKANFPTRISFQVTSKIDSRTILGEQGAEQLLGQGDMLYMAGGGRVTRVHGPFVSDNEVEKVVSHLKSQGRPQYLEAVTAMEEGEGEEGGAVFDQSAMASAGGDLYDQAVAIVLRDRKASTSYIQRRLQIGYNRAASLMERMELEGIVGAANHAGKREILAQGGGEQEDD